jgi:uncharacterized coiled-coil protein SlyX
MTDHMKEGFTATTEFLKLLDDDRLLQHTAYTCNALGDLREQRNLLQKEIDEDEVTIAGKLAYIEHLKSVVAGKEKRLKLLRDQIAQQCEYLDTLNNEMALRDSKKEAE